MPGRGIDYVSPVDYDKLVCARQRELKYIGEQLAEIDKFVSAEVAMGCGALDELIEYVTATMVCYQPGRER